MMKVLTSYNAEHPDYNIALEVHPFAGLSASVATQVAGGAGPDMTIMHPQWLTFWAEQEVVLPVDDLVKASPEYHPEDYPAEACKQLIYKGKTYGFPHASWPTITYFNKTLFDKVGVPYPTEFIGGFENVTDDWTWDKLVELAVPLTTGEGVDKTFGLARQFGAVPTSILHAYQVVYAWGGEFWNEEQTETLVCQEAAMDAIKFQVDLVTKYNVAPAAAQAEGIPGGPNSGRYGMWMWNRSEVPGFENVEFDLGMAPYPRGPKGRVTRDCPLTVAINRQSKYIQQCWEYCMFMSGPKPGEIGGHGYRLKMHQSIPVRKSLFDHPAFLETLLPWESKEIYRDAADRVLSLPSPARLVEMNRVFGEQLEAILLGKITVEEGLAFFCKEANELLKPA